MGSVSLYCLATLIPTQENYNSSYLSHCVSLGLTSDHHADQNEKLQLPLPVISQALSGHQVPG